MRYLACGCAFNDATKIWSVYVNCSKHNPRTGRTPQEKEFDECSHLNGWFASEWENRTAYIHKVTKVRCVQCLEEKDC